MGTYLVISSIIIGLVFGETCPQPLGAANYTDVVFNKLWYEIGKIQTKGGAFFEKDCVCTNINVHFDSNVNINSNATVNNTCNKLVPNGESLIAVSKIIPLDKTKETGKFDEIFVDPQEPGIVAYNVIFLSETEWEYNQLLFSCLIIQTNHVSK